VYSEGGEKMILDWIKANAKEGADLAEAEKLVNDLNPLKNIATTSDALSFIQRNDLFKQALDSETSKRVSDHDKRFQEEKLPDILKTERTNILKELNPDETPEQKRIRELEEDAKQRDARDAKRELEKSLREKAVELKANPVKAERYAVYGDKALEIFEADVSETNKLIETELAKRIKEKFGDNPPPSRNTATAEKQMARADFDNMDPSAKAKFMKDGGQITDQ
jgi:NADH dehydrogenase/NADH:ubiquinone oxidoreductase subunit G